MQPGGYDVVMACSDYKALLPDYVSGDLSADQVRLLKDHLPGCDSCRETVRLLRLDDDAVRRMLFGHREGTEPPRRPGRFVRLSLLLVATLLLCLAGLYFGYGAVAVRKRQMEEMHQVPATDPLEQRIPVPSEYTDLGSFIEFLSREAGAEIEVSDSAEARLRDPMSEPPVAGPSATLGALLEALSTRYGLRYRVEDGRVLIE
jgi:hypothetical protein